MKQQARCHAPGGADSVENGAIAIHSQRQCLAVIAGRIPERDIVGAKIVAKHNHTGALEAEIRRRVRAWGMPSMGRAPSAGNTILSIRCTEQGGT